MKNKILKTTGLLFLIINGFFLNAQLVNLGYPISKGQSKYYSYYAACNSGNDLWVVVQTYDTSKNGMVFKICKNNGLFWTEYFTCQGGQGSTQDLNACFYNGDLYFNVSFNNLVLNSVSYPRMNAIFKWNGTNVSFVDSVSGHIKDMDTFQNKLIILGNFTRVGAANISKLAEYNGSTWSALGTPANWVNFQPGYGYKTSNYSYGNNQVVNQGNKLYITGACYIYDGTKPTYNGLAVYDGTNISPVPSNEFTNSSFQLGEIYAYPDSSTYYSNDSTYKTFYCESGKSAVTVNNKILNYQINNETSHAFAYRNGSVYTLKGTTSGPYYATTAFLEKLTGKNLKRIYLPSRLLHDASRSFGIFGKEAVFFIMGGMDAQEFYRLDSSEVLTSTLKGKVFLDINTDGAFNTGDLPLKYQWITVNPGGIRTLTDENGDYEIPGMDSGKCSIELSRPGTKLFRSPSNGKYIDTFIIDSTYIRNFALSYDSSILDISVELNAQLGWRARRGFWELYGISVKNNSAFTRSGSVNINFDNMFINSYTTDSRLVFNGKKATLTFTNLKPDENIYIAFKLVPGMSGTIGNYYKIWASLDSSSCVWDNDSTNDNDTLNLKLFASCDPNDKSSSPSGDVTQGKKKIQYHINFQNVGNDTAYKVVIVDSIDMKLPLESIIIGTCSHKYKLKVVNNILIFEFNDIKLVDSSTNEPMSKGFVRFSALLNENLTVGEKVNNTAYIYFDYNEAVITNVATVRIVDPKEDLEKMDLNTRSVQIYPNPVTHEMHVLNPFNAGIFEIYNTIGVKVMNGVLNEGDNTIQLDALPPGIYIIKLQNGNSVKFIIQ